MMSPARIVLSAVAAVSFGVVGVVAASCCGSPCVEAPPCRTPAGPAAAAKTAAAAEAGHSTIHNLKTLSANFVRGAQPEGDAAFAELAAMGVKTAISVDGARPDVETARKHGIRYVHVPHGYDGIPSEKMLLLVKTYTTLPGPFFVHCHHGKHRGPAACSVGRMLLDGITAEQAVAEMHEAGTDPKYHGLYAVPAKFERPTPEQLAAVSSDLPSAAPVPAFQQAMVELDQGWTRMLAVKESGWTTPADHPDVAPAHEALMLAELLRELGRRDELAKRPEAFRAHLSASEKAAWDLEKALEAKPIDPTAAGSAFDRAQQSCASCHAVYRDNR